MEAPMVNRVPRDTHDCGVAPLLLGQTDQGTITGVVQDPSGAVIANASVTLRSTDTG